MLTPLTLLLILLGAALLLIGGFVLGAWLIIRVLGDELLALWGGKKSRKKD